MLLGFLAFSFSCFHHDFFPFFFSLLLLLFTLQTIPAPCVLQSPVVQLRGARHWISYARRMGMEGIEDMLYDEQPALPNHVKPDAVQSILRRSQKEEEVRKCVPCHLAI